MLGFLVELVVSLAICGALAYFLFLSAPVDELGSPSTVPPCSNEAYEGSHPSYRPDIWWAPLMPWCERSPLHAPYRYLLSHVLHVEEPLGLTPGAVGCRAPMGYVPSPQPLLSAGCASGRVSPAAAGTTASTRRGRRVRGGPGSSGGTQGVVGGDLQVFSPLRRESTHWVSVLVRWLGVMMLGGGTTSHEVWSDRVWCAVQRALVGINRGWEQRVREREAATAEAQRRAFQSARAPATETATLRGVGSGGHTPLVRMSRLELGPGLAREPAGGAAGANSASSGTSTTVGATSNAGRDTTTGGTLGPASNVEGGAQSGSASPATLLSEAAASLAASLKLTAASELAQWAAETAAAAMGNGNGNGGGGASNPGGTAGNGGNVASGNGPLTSRDVEEGGSFTTSTAPGIAQQLQQQQQQQGGQSPVPAPGAGAPTVGVILPRIAGDIVSIELPFFAPGSNGEGSGSGSARTPQATQTSKASAAAPTTTLTAAIPTPLRCFCVPLMYEDNRFLLRLSCCFPLTALLPLYLAIPVDVLSIECSVTIRRVSFHGALYAAFHGPTLELSFPSAPQFTAQFDVARPASRGGRMASSATTTSAFIATSTMRNVVYAGGGGSSGWSATPQQPMLPHGSGPQQQPPPPPQQQPGQPSPAMERNDKVQEMVLLAVKRAIESITYPNVLEGRVNAVPCAGSGASHSQKQEGLFTWTRKPASLPLYT